MILPIVSILLVILAILIRRLEVFGLYNVCLIYSTSTRWHLNLDSMDSQNLYSSFEFPSEVCQVVSFSNLRIPLVAYLHKLRLSCQNPFGSSQTKTVPLHQKSLKQINVREASFTFTNHISKFCIFTKQTIPKYITYKIRPAKGKESRGNNKYTFGQNSLLAS